LKANLEAAFTTIGRAGFDLETNGTVKLALCAADFAVLVNSGSIKLDDKGQTRFDYTKEDLVKVVTNKFRSYIKPWVSGEGDNSIEKKRYGLENMRSVATMLPNAIKKGVLVLLGDAEIAYTKPAKRLTLDMDVIPASDLPEGDAGKEYVRCVACKYSAVRPSITNKDSKTGKIEKRKNGDASLVVVTDEMASVLYSLHFGKSGTKAVEDKETGWYVMPARVTQPAAPVPVRVSAVTCSKVTTPPLSLSSRTIWLIALSQSLTQRKRRRTRMASPSRLRLRDRTGRKLKRSFIPINSSSL
jgi:hypothetical protein